VVGRKFIVPAAVVARPAVCHLGVLSTKIADNLAPHALRYVIATEVCRLASQPDSPFAADFAICGSE
jgi:hypothetical protein